MSDIANSNANPPDALIKRCTKCGATKPHSEFSKNKAQRDGLQLHCNQCNAKYRSENIDKIHERNACYRIENADKLREYRIKNADKFREGNARWRRENPAKAREGVERWQQANPDKVREYNARYRRENPDKVREYNARYRRENLDKKREGQARWYRENPAKTRAAKHRRRATKRALPSQWSDTDAQRMFAHWKNCCAVCNQHVEPNNAFYYLAQDHWIPLTSPECPGTVPCNILPLCHSKIGNALGCNNLKHDDDPIAWLNRLYPDDPKLVTKILARIAKYFKTVTDGAQ